MGCCLSRPVYRRTGEMTYPDWMAQLPEQLHNVPLNSLSIPGSHDSFSATLQENLPIGPDASQGIKDLVKMFGPVARAIIKRWAIAQELTLTEQLNAGIRYFDLRTASLEGSQELYFLHTLYGETVKQSMLEIRAFLDQHPKEIVLLDFNHFYDVSDEQNQDLINFLTDTFEGRLCPVLELETLTLNTMWENDFQVIIFYNHSTVRDQYVLWPSSYIPSPWPNTTDVGQLMKFLQNNYAAGRSPSTFYVMQGVLTPDTNYLVTHLTGSILTTLVPRANPPVIGWVNTLQRGPQGVNIVIVDTVNAYEYIDTVINLNLKALT